MRQNDEYVSRVNKVQDYIDCNLSNDFSLIELSRVAQFSPYHFHRIFYMMTGETLFQYIQRVRLERAAGLLLSNRKKAITDIALECGFSNQASFAKAFKNYYKMSASRLRVNGITKSNTGKVLIETVCYNKPYKVEVKNIPDMRVIYVRHVGPYKQDSELFAKLFDKLYLWADKRSLIDSINTKWLTLFHDAPDITDDGRLRVSVCMTVDADINVSEDIGFLTIEGGKYAIGHFELSDDKYQAAWNAMFAEWLPQSGYQPADCPCFELYPQSSPQDSEKRVDIYIPIKPI